MLHLLSEKIALFLFDKNDKYPLEIYTYGFELIVSSLIEALSILILGILVGDFIETLIFVVYFSLIRFYSGGYHAYTYMRCYLITVIVYLGILLFYNYFLLHFNNAIILFVSGCVWMLSLFLFYKLCPLRNKSKEVNNIQKNKWISIIVLCFGMTVYLFGFNLLHIKELFIVVPVILSVDILFVPEIIKQKYEEVKK